MAAEQARPQLMHSTPSWGTEMFDMFAMSPRTPSGEGAAHFQPVKTVTAGGYPVVRGAAEGVQIVWRNAIATRPSAKDDNMVQNVPRRMSKSRQQAQSVPAKPQQGGRRSGRLQRVACPAPFSSNRTAPDAGSTLVLPPGSESWSRLEHDLFYQSDGVYNPSKMAQRRRVPAPHPAVRGRGTGSAREVSGRVSVLTPTMSSRQRHHEALWASFVAQDWPDKELIVVETYDTAPSKFLQQKARVDNRLVLVSFPRSADDDFGVGLKRNMTLHLASGSHCVNFDDDDLYAPTYISSMMRGMQSKGLVALTLATWFNYYAQDGMCGYTDQDSWGPVDQQEMEEILYGYGFSYAHKRSPALDFPYPNVDFAEDAPFLLQLRKVYGQSQVQLTQDTEGLCMHIVHRANSAGDMPLSRKVSPAELARLQVAKLPHFHERLEALTSRWPWQMLINMFG